ncbi:DMT family transporter [Rhizobium lentis]|uniref:EamA-like transporter family protein n=1 Tax=Rhizobium lentis TaxID=1138194 RepID=A0ABS7IDK7_9HYPH|nr:DMT family transporter [Rhizobium lentis]MBX4996903.1 EamA-like transporter family protein [Rhizobium lentis]MBX5019464.1 EamA-like transporter family protein [Rhizobium lentis]MBX5064892.1 EamA-like transporter family protein [Rhizobium lentis]MBX5077284.1 EamA-like transporter family protein [Rhizobium lentis]MBX5082837.1 EamA-like transporter family protein [Rhizobium lentis]
MTIEAARNPHPIYFAGAFATGGLLTFMVHLNGELARYGNPLFSSWSAHGTGIIAAVILLLLVHRRRRPKTEKGLHAPLWAYFGGISGAATVMLTSTAVNSPLGLSGTLALGLAGQVVFSVAADSWGLFGLPMRRPDRRDIAALGLVVAGAALIILFGRGAA